MRNLAGARALMRSACAACPTDEDVWLEAARLAPPSYGRVIMAEAVKRLPLSVKLWLAASSTSIHTATVRIAIISQQKNGGRSRL